MLEKADILKKILSEKEGSDSRIDSLCMLVRECAENNKMTIPSCLMSNKPFIEFLMKMINDTF